MLSARLTSVRYNDKKKKKNVIGCKFQHWKHALCCIALPFFKRFPNMDEKFPVLFNAGEPGTISLKITFSILNFFFYKII